MPRLSYGERMTMYIDACYLKGVSVYYNILFKRSQLVNETCETTENISNACMIRAEEKQTKKDEEVIFLESVQC